MRRLHPPTCSLHNEISLEDLNNLFLEDVSEKPVLSPEEFERLTSGRFSHGSASPNPEIPPELYF